MCADCGDDAYIRLSSDDGAPTMLCAHCFVERARVGKLVPVKHATTPTTSTQRPSSVG